MRSTLVILASLALGGCATTGGGQQSPEDIVAQVQKTTAQICSFVPTAATVAALVSGGNPTIVSATALAQAICAAVTRPKARAKGAAIPTVNGVAIEGRFIRR